MFKMTNKLFVVSFHSSPAYIETLVTLMESFNDTNAGHAIFLGKNNLSLSKSNTFEIQFAKLAKYLGNSRFMFTSKSQIEQVAENIMSDGTHLLRQHNQLKWHCYFPLCSSIFLNTPSYLSLR